MYIVISPACTLSHTYVHTLSPNWPKDERISLCVFSVHTTWRCRYDFGHKYIMLTSMLYKYTCSHQCTITYAHINAVPIHMLTSILYRPMSVPPTPPHNHKHTAIRMPVQPFPPLPLSCHKPSPVNYQYHLFQGPKPPA